MNWNKIESILLDLDGTLLDLNFDLHFWLEYIPKVYSEKHNISFQDAKKIIRTVPGIGNKVADCILLFSLEKLDALIYFQIQN
mgnify:CR=1 FL=1